MYFHLILFYKKAAYSPIFQKYAPHFRRYWNAYTKTEKWSCKTFQMEKIFLSTKDSNKCYLGERGVWKMI